ncbi:MAG: MOSC domain-containing protein [Pseudomonadota bacterium]
MTPTHIGNVEAVCRDGEHRFSKQVSGEIELLAGLGVKGDAHAGRTVKHRSRVAVDPSQPNLRQVHLIHGELHDELVAQGFRVGPGIMGENITTRGIDLLGLPRGAILQVRSGAEIEVTGLRNPCKQLNDYQAGLTQAVLDRSPDGQLIRKSGIMGIVKTGGTVKAGDAISVVLPKGPHLPLERV